MLAAHSLMMAGPRGEKSDELTTALRVAQAWGYLEPQAVAVVFALLDRIRAMLWKLSR